MSVGLVGVQSVRLVVNNSTQSQPSNPTGTTNLTGLMMGLAGSMTPQNTGKILYIVSGEIANDTSTDGAKVQLRYGTGSAPANAAALTGTTAGNIPSFTAAANNQMAPFSVQAVISGLTLGTAYWLDVSLAAITGGTATIKNISLTAVEI
jgi:hypothetical protein